ncbi:BTAD domain-containing putative transcriptional regulator [Sinosporangium siamense]|uniref:BTAD domain-containing putative transcriptional regulator n=1 Tax=Sinosporangium siamense TaxID=1367973 RepID=UPI00194DF95F|nr:BTAD domain-containing putative transcriptional regulator [Sinosporangium siamense]
MLGSLAITHGGQSTAPSAAKDRAFLGELLAHHGELVSTEHLVEALWPDRLPADPANAVQVRASRLRSLLRSLSPDSAESLLHTRSGGYELTLDKADLDLSRLQRELARASHAATPKDAMAALEGGLLLWRGEPFCDVPSTPCISAEIARAHELRLAAVERYADLVLAGESLPSELITTLAALSERNPMRESLHYRFMRTMHMAGRSAEALTVYERIRHTLREELGADPTPELQRLYHAILNAEPGLGRRQAGDTAELGGRREIADIEGTPPGPGTSTREFTAHGTTPPGAGAAGQTPSSDVGGVPVPAFVDSTGSGAGVTHEGFSTPGHTTHGPGTGAGELGGTPHAAGAGGTPHAAGAEAHYPQPPPAGQAAKSETLTSGEGQGFLSGRFRMSGVLVSRWGSTLLAVLVAALVGFTAAGLWWRPSVEVTPTPTPQQLLVRPIPGDKSRFDGDITFPDGSTVSVGQRFVKTWKLTNDGAIPWRDRYLYRQWPWDGEDLCQTPRRVPIPDTDPGESVHVSVPVTAPRQPGMCKVYWKMVDEQGNHYMPHLSGIFFEVRVVAL